MTAIARVIAVAAFLVLSITGAQAGAQAGDRLGIVLMHGKQGRPDQGITTLASALAGDGHLVATPEMCWSKRRIYDKPFTDCLAELDKVIDGLRADGATAIVVAGHSLGGNGAIAYAGSHVVKGVISLAGAHNPERFVNRAEIKESLAKARTMLDEGRGAETANFNEVNADWTFNVNCRAETYVSFFDPSGPAAMSLSIIQLHAPILWVAGDRDKSQTSVPAIFAKAPADPLNRLVTVSANHMETPDIAIPAVRDWLKDLAAR